MSVTSIAHRSYESQYGFMRSPSGVTYSLEEITPAEAKDMLARNTDNRRARRAVIDKYARDMESGAWAENGDAISFATDGTLLNGQHRLSAIVQSGVTTMCLVVRGLPHAAQDTMDDLAKRTLGDTFNFHGIQNPNHAAAIVRRVVLWINGEKTNSGSSYQPTKSEALELFRRDHTVAIAINAASEMRKRALTSPSLTGLTWWLFWNIDESDCQQFWESLHTGVGLADTDPIYLLREQIMRYNARAERVPETAYLAWVIKAWNHYRADVQLSPSYKYTFKSGDKFPEPK